ncbi:hypothetical protein H0H92_007497 [Tricholoma furcatifolium]|nr:hypothetical protein H0H92_007497 [Tricholoma furcatifolium]
MSSSVEFEAAFTRAYASSILNKLHLKLGEREAIYLSPIAQRGIAAGDLIPPEVTNFRIFRLGDSLLAADSPIYTGEAVDNYIHQLWSQVAEDRKNKTQDSAFAAAQRYNEILVEAQARFIKAKELDSNLSFWTWIIENAPEVASAEKVRDTARAELSAASDNYFGPRLAESSKYMENIQSALSQDPAPEFNMTGVADRKIVDNILKKAQNAETTLRDGWSHAILRMPLYSIETYASTVQAWIDRSSKGGERDQILAIDVADGRNTKWENYGFKGIQDENVGLSPLISFEVKADNTSTTHNLNVENREDSISLQLSMRGLQEFKVTAGAWDVPNVQTLFPKLLPDAPEFHDWNKLARATSVIVGYDIELKVTFKGDLADEVDKMYDEARQSGGGMTIFGVGVSASDGSDDVKTKFEDVQWNKPSGTMTISLARMIDWLWYLDIAVCCRTPHAPREADIVFHDYIVLGEHFI